MNTQFYFLEEKDIKSTKERKKVDEEKDRVGRLESLPPKEGKRVIKEQEREGGKKRHKKNQRMIRKR